MQLLILPPLVLSRQEGWSGESISKNQGRDGEGAGCKGYPVALCRGEELVVAKAEGLFAQSFIFDPFAEPIFPRSKRLGYITELLSGYSTLGAQVTQGFLAELHPTCS